MNNQTEKKTTGTAKQWIWNTVGSLFLVFSFVALDVWLRWQTRHIDLYPITALAPNLLTLLWAVLFSSLVALLPSRKAGRIAYGVIYFVYFIYTLAQYIVFLVLDRFIYLSDMLLAGEGSDYLSYVLEFINPELVCQLLGLVALGVIGILVFPRRAAQPKRAGIARGVAAVLCALGISQAAALYGEVPTAATWDNFQNAAYEYERFATPNFDMQLTGVYHYLFRDAQVQLERKFADNSHLVEQIDSFFAEKPVHEDNEMTGIFEGKNIIICMLESMDDWIITPEVTPTLYHMMTNGINFTNFYTPEYSSGYTFNTEFAFHLGVYPYSNGAVAYSLTRNSYPYAIANMFAEAGYSANSFHEGEPSFYNRGQMHQTFGYETYNCYLDYEVPGVSQLDDTFLVECDPLYEKMVADAPFCSFVITYSAHLPYNGDNFFTKYALEKYPMFQDVENEELRSLYAKARMTDDMFAGLLERLEADGLLEDTVIVCYSDHYAYGISDKELLQQMSEEAGNPILQNTPAFVYCAALEQPVEVTKTCQTVDLAPTIMNLFGMEVPANVMGSDIFDDKYDGMAVFTYATWVTDEAYVKYGELQWNNGMTDEEILEMNAYIQRYYAINDAILDSDYYAQKTD